MNGPTEREQRWRAAIDNPDDFRGRRLRECMALADEESATLRARVAELQKRLVAIEAEASEPVVSDAPRIWGVRKKVKRVLAEPVWDSSVHGMSEEEARAYVLAHPEDSKLVTRLDYTTPWEEET